jgi:hypothetical protein
MVDQRGDHDPESTVEKGMSTEAAGVDSAETMASTGNEDNAFQDIAAGTATGLGLDRGETVGTGGLASEEDRDEIAEGDSWRQGLSTEPYFAPDRSAERFQVSGGRLGWETGADLDPADQALEYHNASPDRERSETEEGAIETPPAEEE